MRLVIQRRLTQLVWLLVFVMASCAPATQRVELSGSGICPQTEEDQRVSVEGYFGIDSERGVVTEAGWEGIYPYSRFAFSAEPGAKSMFEAAVVRADEGSNGAETANRTKPTVSGAQTSWHIFDNQRREISFGDRV
jgi:hypothetical protein